MKKYDVIVIGEGETSAFVAQELALNKKKVALVPPQVPSPSSFEQTLHALIPFRPAHFNRLEKVAGLDAYIGTPSIDKNRIVTIGSDMIQGRSFVLSTGAESYLPPIEGLKQVPALTPRTALENISGDCAVAVIGAGPVGVCVADRLARRRVRLFLLCNHPQILPHEETAASEFYTSQLEKRQVNIITEARVLKISALDKDAVGVQFEQNGVRQEIVVNHLVLATGFRGKSRGFGFENLGVYIDGEDRIVVNELMRTSAPRVWAAGAVTGPPFSWPLEKQQALMVVNNIMTPFFSQIRIEPDPYPSYIPLSPPYARLGLSETEAGKKLKDSISILHPLLNGDDDSHLEKVGFIKIIARKLSGELTGVHLACPGADEIALFFNTLKRTGISLYDLEERHHFPAPGMGDVIYNSIQEWVRCAR